MREFGQKYSMINCIKGFWEVQIDTYNVFPISKLLISLSVSPISAM